MFRRKYISQSGIAALLTVLIISAAVLIMAVGASFLGLNELNMGYTFQKGGEAMALADGCLEEALLRLKRDNNYGISAGDIPLTLGQGSCIINITDLGFGQRRIQVQGKAGDFYKNIQAEASVNQEAVNITLWQELEN